MKSAEKPPLVKQFEFSNNGDLVEVRPPVQYGWPYGGSPGSEDQYAESEAYAALSSARTAQEACANPGDAAIAELRRLFELQCP